MSAQDNAADVGAALPKVRADYLPLLLPLLLAVAAWPFIPSGSTWVTLTIAGLAMGMMIFVMASGLTLIFGLMDVLNFGHGAFIAIGAYLATLVLLPLAGWMQADSVWLNLAAVVPAVLLATGVTGLLGLAFERIVIAPVYGQHLKQILITMGGMIVAEQLLYVFFGPQQIPLPLPASLRGSFLIGEAAVEKYRVVAVLVGLAVFLAMLLILNRTKIGLLIRAGVENTEMVEALGYRITRLFVGVFMAGSALAGLGGVMWGLYREQVNAAMGGELMVLVFIVVIIGGLGSVTGCFIGALLVALATNYAGFLVPEARADHRHRPDGRGAAVAPARPLSGDQPMTADLSGDLPRSRILSVALLVIVAGAGVRAVPVPRLEAAQRRGQDLHLHRARGLLRPAARLHRRGVVRPHDVLRHRQLRRRHRAAHDGRALGRDRARAARRAAARRLAGAGDRTVFAAGADDLLRHDHARGRVGLRGARLAALLAHRRRGRPQLPRAGTAAAGHDLRRKPVRRRRSPAARSPTTSCSSAARRCSCCCCASSIRRSAACCRRSAKIRSAPRRSAIAP